MKHLILHAFTVGILQLEAGNPAATAAEETQAIRPFHVNGPKEQLVDLCKRIAATRWPEKETVADQSQGEQLATMQKRLAVDPFRDART